MRNYLQVKYNFSLSGHLAKTPTNLRIGQGICGYRVFRHVLYIDKKNSIICIGRDRNKLFVHSRQQHNLE